MKRYIAASALSLSALLSTVGGCPQVTATSTGAPRRHENFGQFQEVCEDTLPKTESEALAGEPFFSYTFDSKIGKVDVEFEVDPLNPNAPLPVNFTSLVRQLPEGKDRLEVYLIDNPNVSGEGNIWTLEGRVYSPEGFLLTPFSQPSVERGTDVVTFNHHYLFNSGCDTSGLEDRVTQNTNDINDLRNDFDNHANSPVPPAHPGTNLPPTSQPSNEPNMPSSEPNIPSPEPNMPSSEPNVPEPNTPEPNTPEPNVPEPNVPSSFTPYSEFVDSSGNPVDPITTRTFRNILVLPRSLEPPRPSDITYTFREMETNQRIYASNIQGPIRTGQEGNKVFYAVTGNITVDGSLPGGNYDLFQVEWHIPNLEEAVADSAEVFLP